MKLDLTSLYFNGDTLTPGNTPSWGTALGQERPDYPISVDGGEELVELIVRNQIEFNPITNNKQSANIRNIEKKKILNAGRFEVVIVNGTEIKQPFFLLVVEETSGEHSGRKSLKYNNKIGENGITNELFYQKIQEYLGNESCWFAHKMFVRENRLNISVIKVSDKPVVYSDSGERKEQWEALVNDFADIKESFKFYCLNIREIKNSKTVSEYIRTMPKIKQWFISHNICESDFKIWDINADITYINNSLTGELSERWKEAAKKNDEGDFGFMMATWNRWNEFRSWYFRNIANEVSGSDRIDFYEIHKIFLSSGLKYNPHLIGRFIGSLMTKPFLILTGLSGSGKTKLAQAFVRWLCKGESQYRIIPVGADWTNREPLLGYPNALEPDKYVKPESGVLDLIIQASQQPELPHFLILDEMNLSHVERYFADFLSVMESKEEIPLISESAFENDVPAKLKVPSNLFIIGTVNIDETTNMFSPKVLDRANTIEFRVTQDEMQNFLGDIKEINMDAFTGKGAPMAKSFLKMASNKNFTADSTINDTLVQFFGELKKTGAEFGYRSATEILRLIHQLTILDASMTKEQKIDIAIMQKLLPKLHGSRRKLCPVLEKLGMFCISGDLKIVKDVFERVDFDFNTTNVLYPLSLEKISRMYRSAIDNGFASFAEA